MRQLSARYFSPKSCLHHYLHMAEGNFRVYLHGERVRLKKYFYVLRPVLACQWVESRTESRTFESSSALFPVRRPRTSVLWTHSFGMR
jgi:predicted nucleotidyltransferase